jgi:acyl-CoA synthetase (AMP-forming)/AMP-acid ligase II
MDGILVLDRLDRWVAEQPTKRLYLMLDDNGKEGQSFTYAEFDNAATNIAVMLRSAGVAPGDRVLLVYPPSLDFLVAFIGCLKASVIAVPVFPPDPRKMRNKMYLFASVAGNSGAKVALTSAVYQFAKKQTAIKEFLSTKKDATAWPSVRWLVTKISKKNPASVAGKGGAAAVSDALAPRPAHSAVAFLQYTSGSTSEPKGVVVSHGNLGHNLKMIMAGLRGEISSVNISWLPQYHDMGLIGSYLGPLWQGATGVYLSPFAFVKNPPLWIGVRPFAIAVGGCEHDVVAPPPHLATHTFNSLRSLGHARAPVSSHARPPAQVLSKYKATHTQTPNFGLALANRKYNTASAKEKARYAPLDLSAIQHVFNAAEPITVDACVSLRGRCAALRPRRYATPHPSHVAPTALSLPPTVHHV